MRYRYITTILLLATALVAAAQSLSERYNVEHPAVIVCNQPGDSYKEIIKAIAGELNVAYRFENEADSVALKALIPGHVTLLITHNVASLPTELRVSKSIIGYSNANALAEVRIIGKDNQLIEQIDDQYMRLRQDGTIAAIEHPESEEEDPDAIMLHITDAILILSCIMLLASLLLFWHIRKTRHHTLEVGEMISLTKTMSQYYAIEDSQTAHDVASKYNAILCNPFVAIAIYDINGQLIVENDAMKRLGHEKVAEHRQPLYDAEGQVTNYLVAVKVGEAPAK